jgi:uncharacterized protein YdiU (UPF0061 family)
MQMMVKTKADFTMTFRGLSELSITEPKDPVNIRKHWALNDLSMHDDWKDWLDHYHKRLLKYVAPSYSLNSWEPGHGAYPPGRF